MRERIDGPNDGGRQREASEEGCVIDREGCVTRELRDGRPWFNCALAEEFTTLVDSWYQKEWSTK